LKYLVKTRIRSERISSQWGRNLWLERALDLQSLSISGRYASRRLDRLDSWSEVRSSSTRLAGSTAGVEELLAEIGFWDLGLVGEVKRSWNLFWLFIGLFAWHGSSGNSLSISTLLGYSWFRFRY